MAKPTRKKPVRKALPAAREWIPPCDAALGGLNWGSEFDGGRADPGRAHALGALIEALLKVDERDDSEVLAVLDQFMLGKEVHVVDHAMRAKIRDIRKRVAWLHIDLRREAVDSLTRTKRSKLCSLLERLQSGDDLGPKYPRDFPDSMKAVAYPALTELDRVMAELLLLDHGLRFTAKHHTFVADVVQKLRSNRPITVPLAAAKISCALNMFEDGARTERCARRLYDSALKNR